MHITHHIPITLLSQCTFHLARKQTKIPPWSPNASRCQLTVCTSHLIPHRAGLDCMCAFMSCPSNGWVSVCVGGFRTGVNYVSYSDSCCHCAPCMAKCKCKTSKKGLLCLHNLIFIIEPVKSIGGQRIKKCKNIFRIRIPIKSDIVIMVSPVCLITAN